MYDYMERYFDTMKFIKMDIEKMRQIKDAVSGYKWDDNNCNEIIEIVVSIKGDGIFTSSACVCMECNPVPNAVNLARSV